MKILLISPTDRNWSYNFVDFFSSMPLSLPLLASLCPPDVEVAYIDEARQKPDTTADVDLVGITVMLPFARRAFEISRSFRQRNIPVIMGGYLPTLYPERALEESDSIVVGEAETVWRTVLDDVKEGRLQRVYKASRQTDLSKLPLIQSEAMPCTSYPYHFNVETTRGCPNRCSYCSVRAFYSDTVRHRPVQDVVDQVREFRHKPIFFVDDNFGASLPHAKRIMRALKPLEILWFTQCSVTALQDDEFVALAKESGCLLLYLGFETVNRASLEEVGRRWCNPETYPSVIEKLHKAGIGVYGSFIFGFDADGPDVFERTLSFCMENRIELATFYIYQPGPEQREALRRQGRMRWADPDEEWRMDTPCFLPKNMTWEDLERGHRSAWREFYSKGSIKARMDRGAETMKREVPMHLKAQIPSLFELYTYLNYSVRGTILEGMSTR